MDTLTEAIGDAAAEGAGGATGRGPAPTLSWSRGRLLRAGAPHSVRSGSLHYFRVVPEHWRDRLLRLSDLGLNTVDTYIPWNFHQPRGETAPDFTGWRDVEAFLETAAGLGLDAILRPGPYICAEWSNGGLPVWLTARSVPLRSFDPGFQQPVAAWFEQLIPRLMPYQAVNGGPVVAFQVENEFGSYGDDADYPVWLAGMLRDLGVEELLYTADGPTDVMLDGGSVPGILTAATLGSKPAQARALLQQRRPDEPFFVAEFWNGWFDHWGHPHHVRDAANAAETVRDILADHGSVSLYMAHGGTNFGLWAGANIVEGELRPTVTSYDSDAPIAEDGRLTDKYFALRTVLGAADAPLRAPDVRLQPARRIPTRSGAGLLPTLRAVGGPVTSPAPGLPSFEDLALDGGLVVYEADVLLPDRGVDLVFEGVADRALVFVDDVCRGIVTGSGTVTAQGTGGTSRLTVVVENLGRVNYGPQLGARKGLLGPVLVERRLVQRWSARPVPVDQLTEGQLAQGQFTEDQLTEGQLMREPSPGERAGHAGISSARFELAEALDGHLRLSGYTKGFVWVNGVLLGRYWNIGPQQTLYVPGPLLRACSNTVIVLELHRSGDAIEFVESPELGPTEQYIEEF